MACALLTGRQRRLCLCFALSCVSILSGGFRRRLRRGAEVGNPLLQSLVIIHENRMGSVSEPECNGFFEPHEGGGHECFT